MEALTNDTGLLQFHQHFCLMDGRYPETRFSEIRHSIEILVEILEAHRPSLAARGILPRDGNPRGGFSWQLRTPSIPWGRNSRLGLIPYSHLEDKWWKSIGHAYILKC